MVSLYIALYLFLAGAGGGAFLLGSVVDLVLRFRPRAARGWFARVSPVTDAGLVLGPVLVMASTVFLVLDLGVPERAFRLFLVSTPSLLSLGAWSIAFFSLFSLAALALGSLAGNEDDELELGTFRRVALRALEFGCSLIATALAVFVVVYSGVYLSMYPSLPFLNTPWVPVLFVASALATGLASLLVTAFFRQQDLAVAAGAHRVLVLDALLVGLEFLALVVFLMVSATGGEETRSAAFSLIAGPLSPPFWLGVVLVGLVAPFSIDVVCQRTPSSTMVGIGAAGSLAGGLVLRIVLLMATHRFNLAFMSALPFWN